MVIANENDYDTLTYDNDIVLRQDTDKQKDDTDDSLCSYVTEVSYSQLKVTHQNNKPSCKEHPNIANEPEEILVIMNSPVIFCKCIQKMITCTNLEY